MPMRVRGLSYHADCSIAWMVQFDGLGKGNFTGDSRPKDDLTMQQYYFGLRKRMESLHSGY